MCSRAYLFLIGAVYLYAQVIVADVFTAELTVGSNVTLEANSILLALNYTDVEVNAQKVILIRSEVVAECLLIGDDTSCNCSTGYVWSNPVCYNYNCCRETTCAQNVSDSTPLCIAKVNVRIKGSVTLNTAETWGSNKETQLTDAFKVLNGFEFLNVTGQRTQTIDKDDFAVADFEAAVSVEMSTPKLQGVVDEAQRNLKAVISVDTVGMVEIYSPGKVCYESVPVMNCTFVETNIKMDSNGWNFFGKDGKRFQLNTGTVVNLTLPCNTSGLCAQLTLQKVTGIWSGRYECGFQIGSVRHTASTELSVALLPDVVTLKIDPLTVDCSVNSNRKVTATATIPVSTEPFKVLWSYQEVKEPAVNTSVGGNLIYKFHATVSCMKILEPHTISVTFTNSEKQVKTATVDVPVIYAGATFCKAEIDRFGVLWPNTPAGKTLIIDQCAEGRVGYKSRTCRGRQWDDVFSNCVNAELNKVLNAADNFAKGLGATQEVAMEIFSGLFNSSTTDTDSNDSTADVIASIEVLNLMSKASEFIVLEDSVFPKFVHAASNMLNNTWSGVNTTIVHDMSSKYLQSVEDLVKNIKVNQSNGVNSPNLDLKFCSDDCNMTVFDIAVNMNKTNGTGKTVAVKNLMRRLKNNIDDSKPDSILVSVTLEKNSSSEIRLVFPQENPSRNKRMCVFWRTKMNKWSEAGCSAKTIPGNRTVCDCNHLTSFAVMMSKSDVSTPDLDMITNVGLGVSVCCLLIFLIVEYLVWSAVVKSNLSHFRHTAIVNIAVFLLLGNCSFLASSNPESLSDNWCLVLTICKHLFYLAMFNWMMCMSVMLVHQLIFVFTPLRKRVFMFFSGIVGYVFPIFIVGSSYTYCKYTEKPYYEKKTCWLVYESVLEGSLHAFLLPVGTVILTNLFSMVVVILTLVKSNVPEGSKADDKETAKSILKVVVFLTPVFGLTWIIGFALLMLEENTPLHIIAIYSFTILNSFQGIFILITCVFAEQKVREEMIKLIMAKSKGKSESMKNLTSTNYTRDK
ncbi:adhesion G protein-coupled receptor F4 isoform X2 [Trematomus bernacchii]|uniref:adhesion G protein-coupled receptor F4 isoform X2 n=1 Tax=Trematomus bernacchii TaxID=40690 RepID=UPI00146A291A|nr:adhesion G protein-coupled receptor F4 isoform X2 [Trematomus bernacchii]